MEINEVEMDKMSTLDPKGISVAQVDFLWYGIGRGWRKRYSPLSSWLIKLGRIGALRL